MGTISQFSGDYEWLSSFYRMPLVLGRELMMVREVLR